MLAPHLTLTLKVDQASFVNVNGMLESVVLMRRHSPDWTTLAEDYHRGRPIDTRRYVPDHEIAGFPPQIDELIDRWNKHFAIDYFTCRAKLAELSTQNVAAIRRSESLSYVEREAVVELAHEKEFLLFFHDDDDLFADDLFERVSPIATVDVDTHVFPLVRVHADLFTFVRDGSSAEFVWGPTKPFDFRFQSNNYALSSRICTEDVLREMKDHVEASRYAQSHGMSERVYPYVISATVKTPCSASILPGLSNMRKFRNGMLAFADRFANPNLPPRYRWLQAPLPAMAELFRAAAA